jgi:hypothetical protein
VSQPIAMWTMWSRSLSRASLNPQQTKLPGILTTNEARKHEWEMGPRINRRARIKKRFALDRPRPPPVFMFSRLVFFPSEFCAGVTLTGALSKRVFIRRRPAKAAFRCGARKRRDGLAVHWRSLNLAMVEVGESVLKWPGD